ncbi:MAG: lysylphosphatidylglycerol synthase transmembrane domain-containing protein [Fluviicola sp.]|jgi:uncharacterized membrane protein YbhN (UPF0104 family)
MKKAVSILLKYILPVGLGTYLVVYLFQSMEPKVKQAFFSAIDSANYFWIILSLLLSVLALFSRAYRWRYTLEPLGHESSFWNRYHALMIGYLINLTIPRAGEASRAAMLFRSNGVPFAKSFGTIVAERVVDLFMLFSLTMITATLTAGDFWEMKTKIEITFGGGKEGGSWFLYAIGGLFLALLIVLLISPSLRKKAIDFIRGLIQGLFSVFKSKNWPQFALHTLFIWSLYLVYFGLPFLALEPTSHVPLEGVMLAFIAGSVGITLTNGGLGVFPLLVGLVVEFYLGPEYGDEAKGYGYALGMIIWTSQTFLVILLGVLSFVLLPKNFQKDEQV